MKLNSNITNLLKVISVVLLIILGNFLFGYKFRSVFTLLKSWIILTLAIFVVCSCKWPKYIKSLVLALLLVLDYFLLKIFMLLSDGGNYGNYDDRNLGLAMVTTSSVIIFFASIVALYFCFKKEAKQEYKNPIIPVIPFIVIIAATFFYYYDFGVVNNKNPSADISQSRKRKVFVSGYKISDKSFRIKNDVFYLKEAWIEKQMQLNHRGVFRKVNPTGKYHLIISKNQKAHNWGYSNRYQYYINGNSKSSKRLFPDGSFILTSDSIINEITITLIRLEKDSVQFKVTKRQ